MNYRLHWAALALSAAACGRGQAAPLDQPATPPPVTLEVRAESIATTVPVAGSVAARRRAEIATRLMARVTSVTVDVGTPVRAGQPLIRLGTADVAASRTRALAARDAAAAARAEAGRHAARMDTLLAQDAVARVQRDQAHLALAQSDAQLAVADAALHDVETAATYATLAAPFDGEVASRSVDPGDLATPGVPLLVVEDAGPRDGVLAVPADLVAGLEVGRPITIRDEAGRTLAAPVRVIARSADPATRTVDVRVTVPASWPSGVAITALVPAGAHVGIAIPPAAVVRRGQLTGVRVLMGDQVVLRWVRLGRDLADGRVEVLSGLEAGDRVVP
ncbi:MAG: efflux RND transporter periplasmic adaptor subunit [Gemmatimonadales bacterium]|nr:efflux RND transporter periplasmic adaptor subunit [Gemmatimonadales bacterium]